MNNRLYGNLIFELSKPGRRGYSLSKNEFGHHEVPAEMRRCEDAKLPECDELTVVRHYTNLSANNFGVNNGFYPLGSCTMKYNPIINEEIAALPQFAALHPLQPEDTCQGALQVYYDMQKALSAITGLEEFTLNPFAGAHGELTGLMVIRAYRFDGHPCVSSEPWRLKAYKGYRARLGSRHKPGFGCCLWLGDCRSEVYSSRRS